MANKIKKSVAYGLSSPLIKTYPTPIISTRNPGANDRAQIGTLWINKSTDDVFVITSIVATVPTWIPCGGGTGAFDHVVATTTVTAGTGMVISTGTLTIDALDLGGHWALFLCLASRETDSVCARPNIRNAGAVQALDNAQGVTGSRGEASGSASHGLDVQTDRAGAGDRR